jgi:hypothetical protein
VRRLIAIILFLSETGLFFSQAGKPYAIWEDQNAGVYRFVSLDAGTGAKTNISILPGIVGFVTGGSTAFNHNKNYYHFISLNNGSQYVFYTIYALTGAVIYSPVITSTLVGVEYYAADSTLYGLKVTGNIYDIVKIDPVTGNDTVVIPIGNFGGYNAGTFCLNTQNGWYSFVTLGAGGNFFLRTYDLNSATLVAYVPFPDNVTGLKYSCADNAVYGLWEDNSQYKLEQIDQLSGLHTTVGTLSGVSPGYMSESQSAGAAGNYTFRGFDSGGNFALFTVDLSSAAIVASANTNDNALGFEEKQCGMVNDLSEKKEEKFSLSVYPVPASDEITISASEEITFIKIYSVDGKFLQSIPAPSVKSPRLNIKSLPSGIYFAHCVLSSGAGVISFSVVKEE